MKGSRWLDLSRAVFAVVGAAALLITVGGLSSGESLVNPVFPIGLGLGALSLAASVLVTAPAPWQAVVTWLGIGAVLLGLSVFGWIVFTDPDLHADAYAFFLVPAAILVAASAVLAAGRRTAGALGSAAQDTAAR
ncbi:MAG TPA: hypothetical protein VHQ42_02925 [Candidatus Limnocylindria bacterium]|nr:hypothetical protein [Candidatus Limnocylindria bacterium]